MNDLLDRIAANPADLVGMWIHYPGDMANPSGRGVVVAVNGPCLDIILEDGREILRLPACIAGGRRPWPLLANMPKAGPDKIEELRQGAAAKKAADELAAVMKAAAFELAESAREIADPPVFFWNGIKDAKGAKLQRCFYSAGAIARLPEGTITIYARDYKRFSDKVRACFAVENDSDTMTDYFCEDHIRVVPRHPLYAQVKAAHDAYQARIEKRMA